MDIIRDGEEDLKEFESIFNKLDIDWDELTIADTKRLIIQEKGEENYDYLYMTKME